MEDFRTRKADNQDLDALDALYSQNMKQHVEKHCRWDPQMFRANFDPDAILVIEIGRTLAGFLKVVYQHDEIYLAEIQLNEKYHNLGVGTALIRNIIDHSEKSGKLITLKVVRGNPAEFLYKRLGFRVFETSPMHVKMSRVPR